MIASSQPIKAAIAAAAGGGVVAISKNATKRQVFKHVLVGALTGGFAAVGLADLVGIPDAYQMLAFCLGMSSWGIAHAFSVIDWGKVFSRWTKG